MPELDGADFASDRLQALIHRVDEQLEELTGHLDEIVDAIDDISEIRSELLQLQADLVFGDPEISPSARLVEDTMRGDLPPGLSHSGKLAEVVKLAVKGVTKPSGDT